MLTIQVIRAHRGGVFSIEYEARAPGRVDARLLLERMQDAFDRDCDPVRAYLAKDGVPIEAAYCRREARD